MSLLTKLNGTINTIWTLGKAGVQFAINGTAATADRTFTLPNADCAVHKNNSTAADPTVTDDSNSQYSANSIWINSTTSQAFICVDPSVGAAVWLKIGPSS
jgi:hypothetical protein